MGKLGYVLKRMREMDYGKMIRAAKTVHDRTGKSTAAVLCDMVYCGFRYEAGYMDYLVFEMYGLNHAQRASYITRGVSNRYVKTLNPQKYWYLLEDKIAFLNRFDGFHGRAWLDLRASTPEQLEDFCRQHPAIVVKPLEGTCGKGIEFLEVGERILSTRDRGAELIEIGQNTTVHGLYDMLVENGQILVEAKITQHPDMSRIYPLSVNTLRLVTMRVGERVTVVFSSLRIGNGLMVDNLNSGGMAVIVDMDTGKISTPGADKDGKVYYTHPMTGVDLLGYEIPCYKASLELVKKAALHIPELGYIAWDVAVSENGPLLIEANHFPGHDIYQFQAHLGADKMGLRPRFEAAFAGATEQHDAK